MIKIRPLFKCSKINNNNWYHRFLLPHGCRYILNLLYMTMNTEEAGSTIEERVRMDEEES
ncbi:MAG: hypothetical protein ACJ71D_14625 [Nitrososphaera sp.]